MPIKQTPQNKKKEYGLTESILAGLGSGVFKIFEGAATLGATLLDLGVDKDRAEAVEDFFAKINPFDEAANATAAGKITELIVNIGVPGGLAFKVGSGLTKATLIICSPTPVKSDKFLPPDVFIKSPFLDNKLSASDFKKKLGTEPNLTVPDLVPSFIITPLGNLALAHTSLTIFFATSMGQELREWI